MKKRIEYIDAMRGFTMLLVVFSHVLTESFRSTPVFSFNEIFISFRMPLFFFLSGFLMFKERKFYERNAVASFMNKKLIVQIIPTIIFMGVFAILFQKSYIELWLHTFKGGYWFTYILFFYFSIFTLSQYVFRKVEDTGKNLILGGVLCFFVVIGSFYTVHPACPWRENWLSGFFSIAQFKYYMYFYFGACVKYKFDSFQKALDGQGFMALIIILFFILQVIVFFLRGGGGIFEILRGVVFRSFLGFLGIIIVLGYFRKYQLSFTKETILGRCLQYIGTRTLDIYLLHYLILPWNLSCVGSFFVKYNNPVVELFAGLLVTLMVVLVCLLISNIIRCSDILAKYLFGKVIPVSNE